MSKRNSFREKYIPGPGHYDPNKKLTQFPEISIARAGIDKPRTSLGDSVSPGPGRYDNDKLQFHHTSPAVKFNKSPKFATSPVQGKPGPTDYQVKDSFISKTISFNKSTRNCTI